MKNLTDLEVARKLEEIEREEETLEEAAIDSKKRYINETAKTISYREFIEGAEWQQGRSYSKEEVKFIERLIGFYWVENNSEHPNNLEEWELSKKLIKQFKNN